jgi:hypothetical protein
MRDLRNFVSGAFFDDYVRVGKQINQMNSLVNWSGLRAAEHALKLDSTLGLSTSEVARSVMGLRRTVQPPYEISRLLGQSHHLYDAARIGQEHNRVLAVMAASRAASPEIPSSVRLLTRQAGWVSEITDRVRNIDFQPVISRLETGLAEYVSLQEGLRSAFRTVELPTEISSSISTEALFGELAVEIERASVEPDGLGIGAAIAHVLSHLTGLNEAQRGYLFVVLLLVVISFGKESIGGIVEVEYERWRNAPDDVAQAHQVEAYKQSERQFEELSERISHPPMTAEVVRRARLRMLPDTGAPLVRTLSPGAHLLVLERRDGWVRVEAEPTPGDVYEGWVYGRLTRYVQ